MIPDPISDIRDLLLADSGVAALAGARVYHSELPADQSQGMPVKTVVLAQVGGPGRAKRTNLRRIHLDTICYGETLYESQQLHDAVREALEELARPSSSIKTIETISEGQNARDPLKQWPVCFATYSVLMSIAV